MITKACANNLLNQIISAYSSNISTKYLALLSDVTVDAEGVATATGEPMGKTGYERVRLNGSSDQYFDSNCNYDSETGYYSRMNKKEIHFNECRESAGWGSFKYFGIYDSSTTGNLLFYGRFENDEIITVANEQVALIRTNSLKISVK